MYRFYWLLDDILAGCSRPGEHERGVLPGRTSRALDRDLDYLGTQRIGALLSLTETSLDRERVEQHGMAYAHVPIHDMAAPTPEQFAASLDFIDRQVAAGRPVAVHCLMGQGRTGSILAAYLIRAGTSVDDALVRLRVACPGAVENDAQVTALHRYAEQRDWII